MRKNNHHQALWTVRIMIFVLAVAGCGKDKTEGDAYGNFEADEVIISAQSQGVLQSFQIVEGIEVSQDQLVGKIDSALASIKKDQLLAQKTVIGARLHNLDAQLKVQDEQRSNLLREVNRMQKLLQDNAATQQQYDDIDGKLKVLDSQTEAMKSQRSIIQGEQSVLNAQLEEVDNLLEKCRITSPLSGTVLEKYVDAGEVVTQGKALFKVADLSTMELKVFVSGSQLSSIVLGDTATIIIDGPNETLHKIKGVISWISSQVEFTPKIIQTREERVNMVYAVKIRVRNDGRLKIGMPGEAVFSGSTDPNLSLKETPKKKLKRK